MSTIDTTSPATVLLLRRVYFARFGFASVWAALFAITGSSLSAFVAALLVLYPAVDVLAAAIDARSAASNSNKAAPATGAYVNIVISTIAAVGLAVAASDDIAAVLRVWGTWAVVAGLVQLIVAFARRRVGGQGAMIVSGGLSMVVGTSFILSAANASTTTSLSGYAAVGGIFFLVSALRLGRTARATATAAATATAKTM